MEIIVPVRSCLLILILWQMAALWELTRSQPVRPFCYTQISAAIQACSVLYPKAFSHNSLVATNGSATNGSGHDHSRRDDHAHNDDNDDDDKDEDDDDDEDNEDDDSGDDDDDDEDDDDDDLDDDDDDRDRDHHHRHLKQKQKQKKKRKRKHKKNHAENKECCRWLGQVDNDCVCEALLKLPTFLIRPQHTYKVKVAKKCGFTYHCPGVLSIRRHHRR